LAERVAFELERFVGLLNKISIRYFERKKSRWALPIDLLGNAFEKSESGLLKRPLGAA
jgi:hypothetical protein